MAGSGGGEEEAKLEHSPTWIVAVVCSVIVIISLVAERMLHYLGKLLKRKNQKPLFEALLKVKEELMLLGFISLLLVVFQGAIQKICIPPSWQRHMLPCKQKEEVEAATRHYATALFSGVVGGGRRLLSGGESGPTPCSKKGKAPLLSLEAIHDLHIFIFVLAVTHVVMSALTMIFGMAKIRQWKPWEDSIQKDVATAGGERIIQVHQTEFIRERFHGIGEESAILSWLHSFFKQFYGSVTRSDYTAMRLGFISEHFKGNQTFNFHKYMVKALEADFKKVVGISWYLWVFVIIFLLLNVNGWHAYFWISFVPLIILLIVGAKLEHVINQLAHEIAEKNSAIQGEMAVDPSDDHFWFHRPRIFLYLIHFILFQNAFEIAFFFWMLTAYNFNACIKGELGYILPRVIVSALVQFLCSYSTLPLYAIVTQMGSSFNNVIFEDHVKESVISWADKVKKRKGKQVLDRATGNGRSNAMELQSVVRSAADKRDLQMEEGGADRIHEVDR